jgi:hypothetical protein
MLPRAARALASREGAARRVLELSRIALGSSLRSSTGAPPRRHDATPAHAMTAMVRQPSSIHDEDREAEFDTEYVILRIRRMHSLGTR